MSADQRISEHLVLFGRYGTADDEVSDFEHAVSGGIGLQEPFGRESDLVALGAAWADGGDAGDETLIEAFYRIGVIKQLAVTPHLQVVVDPPGQPDDDAVAVAGVRLQLTF